MKKITAIVEYKSKWKKDIIKSLIVAFIPSFLLFFGSGITNDFSYIDFDDDFSLVENNILGYVKYNILGFAKMFCLLLFLALIYVLVKNLLFKRQTQMTSLYIDEDKIYGSYGSISKKEMIIPIEQLDNVIVANTIADKLRSGNTILLCSASGKIRFHFIQNANEVSSAILKMINEYKKNYANVSKRPAVENSIQSSDADELKKYKDLLDSGVITQEEFDAKKKQLLGL